MGGTGKTPLVALIAQRLLSQGVNAAIISRGYKSKPGELNDEGKELVFRIPHCTYVQNPRRVQAAKTLINSSDSPTDAIILDDGFQHRKLARNLDIALLDALNPFGYGHICPRGLLRESLAGLRRAQAVLITRADLVEESALSDLEQRVLAINPNAVLARVCHQPGGLVSSSGFIPIDNAAPNALEGKDVLAFCGLGNPDGFRHTVESLSCRIARFITFPDHYSYSVQDENNITSQAKALRAQAIVCSMKDYVKLSSSFKQSPAPLYGIQIDIRFLTGEEHFWNLLDSTLTAFSR